MAERRRRELRSEQEWKALIAARAESGQSVAAFCSERKISLSSFHNAAKRFAEQAPFFEVAPSAAPSWEGEVLFPNGVVIRIRG